MLPLSMRSSVAERMLALCCLCMSQYRARCYRSSAISIPTVSFYKKTRKRPPPEGAFLRFLRFGYFTVCVMTTVADQTTLPSL